MKLSTHLKWNALIPLLLTVGAVAVYWTVWNAQFLRVDDPAYVIDNDHGHQLSWANVKWAFTQSYDANYHPLTWISHMADGQMFGVTPRWPHVENVLLHIANSILLFFLLVRMTGRRGCSALAAGIFALHPQHVESVAWVAERKDMLSGLFFLLTMMAYVEYTKRPTWGRYAGVAGVFLLALMCKPVAVTLPCALLLLDVWPLGRLEWMGSGRSGLPPMRQCFRLIVEKTPLFMMTGGWCVLTVIAQARDGAVVSMDRVPLGMRMGNAIVSYARYLRKFLWPSDLSAFYPMNRPWAMWIVIVCAIVLLGITALAVLNTRRRPYIAFGWFWFLGTLVPMIGLVTVGNAAMADRYMYLPMIGLAVVAAWGGAEILSRAMERLPGLLPRRELIAALAGCAAIAACALVTANDVPWWRETEGLYRRSLARTEDNAFAHFCIGGSMTHRGDHRDAIRQYSQCVRLQPSNANAYRALGLGWERLKQYDRAAEALGVALRLDPGDPNGWSAMGLVDMDRKHWPQAAADFGQSARLDPRRADAWTNLAVAHHALGKLAAAEHDLDRAVSADPRLARAWFVRGTLMLETHHATEAARSFTHAAALEPRNADARYQLGLTLMESGRGKAAIAALMEAVHLRPDDPASLARLAWVLATHPDHRCRHADEALFFASRAAELTNHRSPDALDALAAAQAEKGEFSDAAKNADRAEALARSQGDAPRAKEIAARAAQYRAGRPERDASLAGADAGELLP